MAVPRRSVPPAKPAGYLLDPGHPFCGPKAASFRALGFSADRPDVMTAALVAHPDRHPVDRTEVDRWGTRYVVRCTIETPDGRNPCILTIWIVPPDREEATLVTAYPADASR